MYPLYDNEEATDIKCLNKEKISSIIKRFKIKKSLKEKYLRFLVKKTEIDELDPLKRKIEDLTVEEFGLKNNSVILYRQEN